MCVYKHGWNFPSNNSGQTLGISETGIETFKGALYRSLAREICQNSLDAVKDENTPVHVEFKKFYLCKEDIPSYEQLEEAFFMCREFWIENEIKKASDLFKASLEKLNQKQICVLRISDFNTVGLTGSKKDKINTNWNKLVKGAGISDKGDSDGGSFGIGKSAPFACSDFRTVFYGTCDIDGICATQGVARLSTFKDRNGENTQGIGFYGNTDKNTPIYKEAGLDVHFKRGNVPGTDIFVLGFVDNGEAEKSIVYAILDFFAVSIFDNKLSVTVGDVLINKDTIGQIITDNKEHVKLAYDYYRVLTSQDTIVIEKDFFNIGTINLYVLYDSALHRTVLLSRKNGMKLFDKKNISGTIYFSAIVRMVGDGINSFFRQMENPQHDAWEDDRHSDSKLAKKFKTALFKLIKDEIIANGKKTIDGELEAEGVGEYLPDNAFEQPVNSYENKEETISDKTKALAIKVAEKTPVAKGIQSAEFGYISDEIDGFGDFVEPETNNYDRKSTGQKNNKNGSLKTKQSTTDDNEGDNPAKKWIEVGASSIRLMITNAETNEYRLVLIPEKNASQGHVKLQLAGEQSNVEAKILTAWKSKEQVGLKCNGGKVFIDEICAKEKLSIDFTLDYNGSCSMEVNLYGYSS